MSVNKIVAGVIFCLSVANTSLASADVISTCFAQIYQNSQLTPDEQSVLRQSKVVFVEGLLNETARKLRLGYFQPQKDFLDTIQVSYTVLKTSSKDGELENSEAIYNELRQITNQNNVILFTHSRGGILSLRALMRDESLWPKISGWIAVQTPFQGTALADKIKSNIIYEKLGLLYLEAVGSNAHVFKELTTEQRLQFYNAYKENIKRLLSAMPILTVGSEVEGYKPKHMGYYIHPTRGIVFPEGSDGVVAPMAAILRADGLESAHIYWPKVGHRDIVFPNKKRKSTKGIDSEKATAALFKLLLQGECGELSRDV